MLKIYILISFISQIYSIIELLIKPINYEIDINDKID